jgi:hypothetical protein
MFRPRRAGGESRPPEGTDAAPKLRLTLEANDLVDNRGSKAQSLLDRPCFFPGQPFCRSRDLAPFAFSPLAMGTPIQAHGDNSCSRQRYQLAPGTFLLFR